MCGCSWFLGYFLCVCVLSAVPAGSRGQCPPAPLELTLPTSLLPKGFTGTQQLLGTDREWGEVVGSHRVAEKCIFKVGFIALAWHHQQALAREQNGVAKSAWRKSPGCVPFPLIPKCGVQGPWRLSKTLGRCSLSCAPFSAHRLPGTGQPQG